MLYTGKGDKGTTQTFGCCDQRISKGSVVTEALGSLDEINSFLGVVKMHSRAGEIAVPCAQGTWTVAEIVGDIQQYLFVAQAEIAGADKHIEEKSVRAIEDIINTIEAGLPPVTTFFVSGGTELSAIIDFARTLARRAERRVVGVVDEGSVSIHKDTLAYLNRLSSLLYALARQVNLDSGITEESPTYQ